MLQNITMSKGGAYSLATRGAADVINASIPMIEQALSEMDLRGKTEFFGGRYGLCRWRNIPSND